MAERKGNDSTKDSQRGLGGRPSTDSEQPRTTGQAAPASGKHGRQPAPFVEGEGPFDGQAADSHNPAIQAFGSEEEAAAAANDAAEAAGGHANKLFTGSPGEEGPAPNIPSSLGLDSQSSAARSGRAELEQRVREHNETSPAVTGGDVDAAWESAYSVGDEAPGGDNPTPDQQSVEEVAGALGVEYQDTEELKAVDKIEARDRHRWELDPASSEDFKEREGDLKSRRKK